VTGSLEAKVAVLENTVKEHDIIIKKQIEKNESQIELNTIFKMQVESNVQITETLNNINNNLTNLNHAQQELRTDLGEINTRVGAIEQASDENTIKPTKLLKWAFTGLGAIIVTLATYYFASKFGLK
jgi:septal ring factor EnvC (AmiA/AmiB activator)